MNTQLTLWTPRRRRGGKHRRPGRRVPRCDDCGRRIWASRSLHRRFGLLLGGGCYRKRARAARRLAVPQRITVRDPGHIPGQLAITDPDQDTP